MRLVFAGTPAIAAKALKTLSQDHEIVLVITRPDSPIGRKQVITPSAVAQMASELGIPVLKTNKIAEAEIAKISRLKADLGIVVAYGALIPQAALDKLVWWNLHFSLLPMWRGATPLQHSMMTGKGSGISVFELEAGLDTGPIVASLPVALDSTETAGEALERFTLLGSKLILEALSSSPVPTSQQGEVTFAPKISRAQARLDFNLPADEIARKINALNPEPAAWAELEGNAIKLLRAKPLGSVNWNAVASELSPGEVGEQGGRVLIGAGAGTQFELLELQPAGKKPMAAGDWYRGISKAVKFD